MGEFLLVVIILVVVMLAACRAVIGLFVTGILGLVKGTVKIVRRN